MKKIVNKEVRTPEQIAQELKEQKAFETKQAEVKKTHKVTDAFRIKIDNLECWVKKPGRNEVAMARSLGEGDYVKVNELLLDAIWLEGDEAIRTDDDNFLQVIPVLDTLIEAKQVELKKN